jgi:integrase/recombinase XerC
MTLTTATRRFLTQLEADGKSPLTISVYRRELDRFGRWLGAQTDVRRVTPDRLARYLTDPALQVTPSGTKRNARTMNRTRTVLRLLFGYLAMSGTLRHDPSRLLKNARTDRPLPTPMTEAEEARFVRSLDRGAKSAQGRRDRALFTLLLRSGMRLAAALALDVADLDLRTGTARSVGKTRARDGGRASPGRHAAAAALPRRGGNPRRRGLPQRARAAVVTPGPVPLPRAAGIRPDRAPAHGALAAAHVRDATAGTDG